MNQSLETEFNKLKESSLKKDDFYKEKLVMYEERCQKYEKDFAGLNDMHSEEIDRLKKTYADENQALRIEFAKKLKETEDRAGRVKQQKDEAETKVKELSAEIINIKTGKDKELYELEKKLKTEYNNTLAAQNKTFDTRIKQLELAREDLLAKGNDNIEKLRLKEKSNSTTISRLEKELAQAKDELLNQQKENAAMQSKLEQALNEQQMNTSTMERFDANRIALTEEIKKIKNNDKMQNAKLKSDQEKERKLFEQVRGQLLKRIEQLEKDNVKLKGNITKIRQDEDMLCNNLIGVVKTVVAEKYAEYKQTTY